MASNLPKLSLFALLLGASLPASPLPRPAVVNAQATTITTNETLTLTQQSFTRATARPSRSPARFTS